MKICTPKYIKKYDSVNLFVNITYYLLIENKISISLLIHPHVADDDGGDFVIIFVRVKHNRLNFRIA